MPVIKAEFSEQASEGLLTFGENHTHTVLTTWKTREEFTADVKAGVLDRFETKCPDTAEQRAEFYRFDDTIVVFENKE